MNTINRPYKLPPKPSAAARVLQATAHYLLLCLASFGVFVIAATLYMAGWPIAAVLVLVLGVWGICHSVNDIVPARPNERM